jgi:F-type H+-transporting ATPase subunit epsilon
MILRLITQEGIKFTETIDYAVISNSEGEFAILNKHIPVVTTITEKGFIKMVVAGVEFFIVVDKATIVHKDNTIDVFALNSAIGKTHQEAIKTYLRVHHDLSNLQKRENADYSKLEKDLRDSIVKAQAGRT